MGVGEEMYHLNGHTGSALKIIIVGAGIGGLSAAINLRKQGHEVIVGAQIFETSGFATELGAAIHIPPNVYGLLERMGIDVPGTGANLCQKQTWWSPLGQMSRVVNVSEEAHLWKHPWVLGHRIALHDALKKAAIKSGAFLKLSSPVDEVDPASGTVKLSDGTKDRADVVVGADGVHSVTRNYVPGGGKKPFGTGKSVFRFLIPRERVLQDQQTAKYAQDDGTMLICFGPDRRLIMYPTSNNTLLNFVCIHPEEETAASSTGDWNNRATVDLLLKTYKDYGDGFKALLAKAEEGSLKLWRLLDMEVMEHWTEGRLVLLGDAVHPFLPYQGQGGTVAIEDATALGLVLEQGVRGEDIGERLKLYQCIRKERADHLQHVTRLTGQDLAPGETQKVDFKAVTDYTFGFDEFDNTTQRLREWKWSKQPASLWSMPVGFGPAPGPRQNVNGLSRDCSRSTFVTSSIKFRTSRTVLQNLLPPGSTDWKFSSVGTNAFASISTTSLDKVEGLGGKSYSFCCLFLHGIQYTNKDGKTTCGIHVPVIFEDLTGPVITGRDELGIPKLFSAISKIRSHSMQIVQTSWGGATWGTFEWEGLEEVAVGSDGGMLYGASADEAIIAQRYFPAAGKTEMGLPAIEEVILDRFAASTPKPCVQRMFKAKGTRVTFAGGDEVTLPTLHYITSRLAEIPIYEIVEAKILEGTGIVDLSHMVTL